MWRLPPHWNAVRINSFLKILLEKCCLNTVLGVVRTVVAPPEYLPSEFVTNCPEASFFEFHFHVVHTISSTKRKILFHSGTCPHPVQACKHVLLMTAKSEKDDGPQSVARKLLRMHHPRWVTKVMAPCNSEATKECLL